MLDTNIISYLIKNRDFKLIDKFEKESKNHTIVISVITVAELYYGVKKKASKKLEVAVSEMLSPLKKLDFCNDAAYEYGNIRANLESKGSIIGSNDLLIAAHAKAIGATLITNNTKEFNRVEGLKLDNWI